MSLAETVDDIKRLQGQRDQLRTSLDARTVEVRRLGRRDVHLQDARALIQEVAKQTQAQLEFRITEIVSLALEAVFDDPYKLKVEFVEKRGRTECELSFVRGNEESVDPLTASGGGAVDVAAFALRIAIWSLTHPRSRGVFILDEPFRFLSVGLRDRAGIMLKELSEKLGVQIIMVTHDSALTEAADKVFFISQNSGVSSLRI